MITSEMGTSFLSLLVGTCPQHTLYCNSLHPGTRPHTRMAWRRTSAATPTGTPEVPGATQQTLMCAFRAVASSPAGKVSSSRLSLGRKKHAHTHP